jgi:hypothetical protein
MNTKPPTRLGLVALLTLGVIFLCSGCGTYRFNRAWNDAESDGNTEGVEARWEGDWRSDFNGHSGGLRCITSETDDGRLLVWFHSTYAGIFTFQYKTLFTITETDDRVDFVGEQDLGWLAGGLYQYEGTVEGDCFRATYRAENDDHGVFEMKRVESGESDPGN